MPAAGAVPTLGMCAMGLRHPSLARSISQPYILHLSCFSGVVRGWGHPGDLLQTWAVPVHPWEWAHTHGSGDDVAYPICLAPLPQPPTAPSVWWARPAGPADPLFLILLLLLLSGHLSPRVPHAHHGSPPWLVTQQKVPHLGGVPKFWDSNQGCLWSLEGLQPQGGAWGAEWVAVGAQWGSVWSEGAPQLLCSPQRAQGGLCWGVGAVPGWGEWAEGVG